MKKGAGDDPFAEDAGSDGRDDSEEERSERTSSEAEEASPAGDASSTEAATGQRQTISIPYKFRRDGVQDDRSRVPLFLQSETKAGERDALREFEDRFDDNVSLTDLREALVMVGLQHMDEVEAQLEDWGYGMTFE